MALLAGVASTPIALVLGSSPAGAATTTSYTAATPTLDSISNPGSCTTTGGSTCAPWNEYQGDTSASSYPSNPANTNLTSPNLFPSYIPGGPTTTGGYPNASVVPAASGNTPYPSGVVGTPGPLDDYCGSGSNTTESAGAVSRQPVGSTLPLGPAYFPHVVRNSDGSLTGYFDYRPKDGDEALMAATSTDGGKDWTYAGEALEQNKGYCPTADTNDDGEGHANLVTVGGSTFLYTLERAAGDMQGVGMIVHSISPTGTNPLNGLPASEPTGIDPDAFATTTAPVSATASTISVTSTGTANSPLQLTATSSLNGYFVDVNNFSSPVPADAIVCTGTTATSLTACTSSTARRSTRAT